MGDGSTSGPRPAVLNKDTLVPVGIVTVVFGAAVWLTTIHNEISYMRQTVDQVCKDHEARIRNLELAKRP